MSVTCVNAELEIESSDTATEIYKVKRSRQRNRRTILVTNVREDKFQRATKVRACRIPKHLFLDLWMAHRIRLPL